MKYSEFKAEVEKLGWFVSENKYNVHVITPGGGKLMVIDKTDTHVLDPDHIQYVNLTHEYKSALLDLSVKLVKTPLAEREEEKRYYLRLVTKIDVYEDRRYLNMDIPNEKYTLSENKDDAYYKAIFTESEISQMDITGFQKVEVLG